MGLAGRLEATASNPHSSPDILDNVTKYPFKPYGFPVVSDPVVLLYRAEKSKISYFSTSLKKFSFK